MNDTTAREHEPARTPATRQAADVGRRLNRAFGPIVAGLIIDLVDLATFGPIGLVLGLPVGGLAGYWMGRCLRLGTHSSLLCAAAAGVYCTMPFTHFLPLATLVGAYARFVESGRERRLSAESSKSEPEASARESAPEAQARE